MYDARTTEEFILESTLDHPLSPQPVSLPSEEINKTHQPNPPQVPNIPGAIIAAGIVERASPRANINANET